MRLVASVSFPVVPLVALSLASWASTTVAPVVASVAPPTDIVSSDEPIAYRHQVSARREPLRHSVWKGTYVCRQGLSSVTLTIDFEPSGVATARYDFGPVPSNPTVPKTGAFILVGSVHHRDGGGLTGELAATKWIVRPDNYFMVPLSIESHDGLHLRGRIHDDSCSQFQATRTE
jgi:hypothetical protein